MQDTMYVLLVLSGLLLLGGFIYFDIKSIREYWIRQIAISYLVSVLSMAVFIILMYLLGVFS